MCKKFYLFMNNPAIKNGLRGKKAKYKYGVLQLAIGLPALFPELVLVEVTQNQ